MPKDSQPALTPKLRFPEFRNGPDWEAHPLSSLTRLSKGDQLDASDKDVDGLYPHYNGGISPSSFTHKHNRKANTIIISEGGNSCGYVQFIRQPFWSGGHCYSLEPRPHVNTLALFYALQAKQREIMALRIGSGLPNIQKSTLLKFELSFPILESEQQKIAECLSTLDELIGAESQKLDALKAHKKGLMQQLFPREGETRPRLRFPEFQSAPAWEEDTLTELFDFQDGFTFKSTDFTNEPRDATQVIRITDINNCNKNPDKVYVSNHFLETVNLRKYYARKGDLLLSLTGAAGFNFFVWDGAPALLNQRTTKITPKAAENAALIHLLEPLVHAKINARGEGQNNNLSREFLSTVVLRRPKPAEQHRIATCLSSLDELIAAQSDRLAALRTHKQGLLQQLFPSTEEVET
jgi:type I restriction enzyme S subunit